MSVRRKVSKEDRLSPVSAPGRYEMGIGGFPNISGVALETLIELAEERRRFPREYRFAQESKAYELGVRSVIAAHWFLETFCNEYTIRLLRAIYKDSAVVKEQQSEISKSLGSDWIKIVKLEACFEAMEKHGWTGKTGGLRYVPDFAVIQDDLMLLCDVRDYLYHHRGTTYEADATSATFDRMINRLSLHTLETWVSVVGHASFVDFIETTLIGFMNILGKVHWNFDEITDLDELRLFKDEVLDNEIFSWPVHKIINSAAKVVDREQYRKMYYVIENDLASVLFISSSDRYELVLVNLIDGTACRMDAEAKAKAIEDNYYWESARGYDDGFAQITDLLGLINPDFEPQLDHETSP